MKKKMFFGVVLSYASQFVHIIVALAYTPFLLRILGKSEYGLYQLAASIVSYLSLLSLGFSSSYVRFYFKKKQIGEKEVAEFNGMFLTIFLVLMGICCVAGGVLVANITTVFGTGITPQQYPTARVLMGLMVINLAITFPLSVFSSYITAQEEFILQKGIVLIGELCNPLLCIPLLLKGYGSISLIMVALCINIFQLILNIYIAVKKLGMHFSFHNFHFGELKEMWAFTFFIFLNQIIDQINWNVDKFLLGRYLGTGVVAVYSIASQLNSLYISVSTSVSNVFAPRVNKIAAESNDNKKLSKIFADVGRIQLMLLLLVLSGIIIFGQRFIALWAGEGYEEAYVVALLLLIPVTIPLIQNVGIEIQRAKNMHKARSVVYFFMALANVLLSIPLIQYFGIIGATMATFVTMLAGNGIFMNWYYHKKMGIDVIVFFKNLSGFLPVIAVCVVLGIGLRNLLDFSSFIQYGGAILLYTMGYCVCLIVFVLRKDEKEKVLAYAKKIFGKKRK